MPTWKYWCVCLGLGVAVASSADPTGRTLATHNHAHGLALTTKQTGVAQGVLAAWGGTLARIDPMTGLFKWRRTLESDGGPIVAGTTAVLQGCGGGYCLYGVDTETGDIKWTLDHTKREWDGLGGRSGTITTDGTLIYSSGRFPESLFALQPQTGRLVWTHATDDANGPRVGFVRWIVPSDGRLITSAGIISATTGRLLKTLPQLGRSASDGVDGLLVLGSPDGTVSRLNATTFAPLWTRRLDPFESCQVLTTGPVVAVAGRNGEAFVGVETRVSVLDPPSGAVLWTTVLHSTWDIGSKVLAGDREHVYATYSESDNTGGKLIAYRARTGHVDWVYRLATTASPDAVVTAGESLYLREGEFVTALDSGTGLIRWRTQLVPSR
jgi:outer membrane protein assembly factor BamB